MENTQLGLRFNKSDLSTTKPFPPRRNYTSLSVADLLEARDAYHVYLSGLENVVATAIGRYRIHEKDWFAAHPPDERQPENARRVKDPRTLNNSIVRPWSWPAVLVFVRHWQTADSLGDQIVPRALYLPDGRVIPTCVILATPDETPEPPVAGPSQVSGLIGGGYACLRHNQGIDHLGSFGCLVYQRGTYYALTNRHVAGAGGDEVKVYVYGGFHRVGQCADIGVTRLPMSEIFSRWPANNTYLTIDAGLVRIDDFEQWTSQVFGVGEVGETFDATEQSVSLDLIGCPVRAFGGTSGVIEGEIQALFYRYQSLGGFDYATDVLIGPRTGVARDDSLPPLTQPGDSGTLWFYDPPPAQPGIPVDPDEDTPAERGARARRLRPIAMQWGGQRFRVANETPGAFALATFLSTICRALDVDVVRNWSTGHDEYWGKLGHFAIGFKACDQLSGSLKTLMKNNQDQIGVGDQKLKDGADFRVDSHGFVSLADVPDYLWVTSKGLHPNEGIQHFADIDIHDINGGKPLLDRCNENPANVSARVWKEYFDGFATAGVGPEEGAIPFRVWQIWDAMVAYLKAKDVIHFVAAAGVLGHYVGDASQPLHCSYMHHGVPPMKTVHGRKYPVPRTSAEFIAFKDTKPADIHGIYEETMLEIDTAGAMTAVNNLLASTTGPQRNIKSGHEAAVETVRLMFACQKRLSPKTIINADKPNTDQGPKARATALWNKANIRKATVASLADSARLLADIWKGAWKTGNGNSIAANKLIRFEEADLDNIYRKEKKFIPSLSLDEMVTSGKFEPPA